MATKSNSVLFVGMDVHKESIDIVLAEAAAAVRHYGQIGAQRADLTRVIRKLTVRGSRRVFVYEAGRVGTADTGHRAVR